MSTVAEMMVHNKRQFIEDLRKANDFQSFATHTGEFFKIRKMDVKSQAARGRITYYMTRDIFKVKRNSMVII